MLPSLSIALLLSAPAAAAAGAEVTFVPAGTCSLCHTHLDDAGQFPLWSGSMMAHSSRDPFWKAKVRQEISLGTAAAEAIEDTCLRCHAPSQQYGYRARGGRMSMRDLPSGGGEGVTCTVCHQILAEGLGTRESFTGGFRIGMEDRIFGPHPDPFTMPMLHHTGYMATEARHILDAALCGTCHTVITATMDRSGRTTGQFLEQAPYLEWLASDYPAAGVTCQSCHVPPLENERKQRQASYIAHRPPGGPFPPTRPRSPFGLHFFAGANAAMLEALAGDMPDEAAALRRTADRARRLLESAVDLRPAASRTGDRVEVTVDVVNLAGHKLPTGFPSRRVWLDVSVLGDDDSVLFESGAWDRKSCDLFAPREATVYEAVYRDATGVETKSLLRATSYAKDSRILPRGFDASRPLPGGLAGRQVGVTVAGGGTDFRPGSHRARYEFRVRPGSTPARVRVKAWYQSINPAYTAGGLDPRSAQPVRMAVRELALPPKRD